MADTLNKTDLVAAIAAESGQSQAAVSGVVDAFFDVVAKSVGVGHQGRDPGLDLVRADPPRRTCGPQPRDGRHDPDRREQGRQGLGRQQAEGCRQGLSLVTSSKGRRPRGRRPSCLPRHRLPAQRAPSTLQPGSEYHRMVTRIDASAQGRPCCWSSLRRRCSPRSPSAAGRTPTLRRSGRRRALRPADRQARHEPRGGASPSAPSPSPSSRCSRGAARTESSAAPSTSRPPAPGSGPSPAPSPRLLTFSSVSYIPLTLDDSYGQVLGAVPDARPSSAGPGSPPCCSVPRSPCSASRCAT